MTSLDFDAAGKWSRVAIVKLQYCKSSEGVPEVVSALRKGLNRLETGMTPNETYKFLIISITDCFRRVAV
jgi:hypothetical protein